MTALNDFFNAGYMWLSANWQSLVYSVIGIIAVYGAYRILSRELVKLKESKRLEENVAVNLNRVFKWMFALIAIGVVVAQFGFDVGLVAGFMALAGGTILGFASMNSLQMLSP